MGLSPLQDLLVCLELATFASQTAPFPPSESMGELEMWASGSGLA